MHRRQQLTVFVKQETRGSLQTACIAIKDNGFRDPLPLFNSPVQLDKVIRHGTALEWLDEHLHAARSGAATLTKPLVIYEEDRIDEETIELGADVVIAEGVYTSLLENVDLRVFIARNRLETLEHRTKRGREAIEPFIESVLEVEHEIISAHRALADVVISKDYDLEFVA